MLSIDIRGGAGEGKTTATVAIAVALKAAGFEVEVRDKDLEQDCSLRGKIEEGLAAGNKVRGFEVMIETHQLGRRQ